MEVFEALLLYAIIVSWVLSWVFSLYDIFIRRRDISTIRKVLWAGVVVLLPGIGVVLYVVMRQPPRALGKQGPDRDPAEDSVVDRLSRLVDEHAAGKVSDEDFADRKASLLGL